MIYVLSWKAGIQGEGDTNLLRSSQPRLGQVGARSCFCHCLSNGWQGYRPYFLEVGGMYSSWYSKQASAGCWHCGLCHSTSCSIWIPSAASWMLRLEVLAEQILKWFIETWSQEGVKVQQARCCWYTCMPILEHSFQDCYLQLIQAADLGSGICTRGTWRHR